MEPNCTDPCILSALNVGTQAVAYDHSFLPLQTGDPGKACFKISRIGLVKSDFLRNKNIPYPLPQARAPDAPLLHRSSTISHNVQSIARRQRLQNFFRAFHIIMADTQQRLILPRGFLH